jgi:hypothetical protein
MHQVNSLKLSNMKLQDSRKADVTNLTGGYTGFYVSSDGEIHICGGTYYGKKTDIYFLFT